MLTKGIFLDLILSFHLNVYRHTQSLFSWSIMSGTRKAKNFSTTEEISPNTPTCDSVDYIKWESPLLPQNCAKTSDMHISARSLQSESTF